MQYEIRQPGCTAYATVSKRIEAKYLLMEARQMGLNAKLFLVHKDGERVPACEHCGGPIAECGGLFDCERY